MEYILLKGIVTGLILSIMLGPVFFLLIETSIRKGIRSAFYFDLGVFSSDFIYISVAYIFYHEISSLLSGSHIFLFKAIGGLVFIAYGVIALKKKRQSKIEESDNLEIDNSNNHEFWSNFIKGFILNFANPMIILYWLSVITIGIQREQNIMGIDPIILYMATILLTFFAVDVGKIFAAKKLQPVVTPQLLKNINFFIAIILIGFGAVLTTQGLIYFVKL